MLGGFDNVNVPEEFYLYWNEAVNTYGYPAKLLLMFSALEALFSKDREKGKGAYYAKIEAVLGQQLKVELYGTKDNPGTGLRQRLMHGEYFGPQDTSNYVELVHKRVIGYFNSLFGQKLIKEEVVHPQRHLSGNRQESRFFIRGKGSQRLGLKEVLTDLTENGLYSMQYFEYVHYDGLSSTY